MIYLDINKYNNNNPDINNLIVMYKKYINQIVNINEYMKIYWFN